MANHVAVCRRALREWVEGYGKIKGVEARREARVELVERLTEAGLWPRESVPVVGAAKAEEVQARLVDMGEQQEEMGGTEIRTHTFAAENFASALLEAAAPLEVTLTEIPADAPSGPEWPKEAEVRIDGYCPNPRVLRGVLVEDGRKVSVWRTRGRSIRYGVTLPCRLDKVNGDAFYLPV